MHLFLTVVWTSIGLARGDYYPVCGERTLEKVYEWPVLTFQTPVGFQPDISFRSGDASFAGIDVGYEHIFLALPRDVSITPATLATVPKPNASRSLSPPLQPYPNMAWNTFTKLNIKCNTTLVSVHSTVRDRCNRLWVLDSGVILDSVSYQRVCQPKIVIFDLDTNQLVRLVPIPGHVLTPTSKLVTLVLDHYLVASRTTCTCEDPFVYIADTNSPALIVHRQQGNEFFRITHPSMDPDPKVRQIQIEGEPVLLTKGIRGMAAKGEGSDRALFYQTERSLKTRSVPTSVLQALPAGEGFQLPVREVFSKPSPALGLHADQADGCLLSSPVANSSIVGWGPVHDLHRTLVYDPLLISVIPDFQQDFLNLRVVYAISVRPQIVKKILNLGKVNWRVLKITQVKGSYAL